MNEWISGAQRMFDMLLGHPGSRFEYGLLAGLSALTIFVLLGKVGGLLGIRNTGASYSLAVGVAGVLVMVLAMVAVGLYLPDIAPRGSWWPLPAAGVVVAVAVVAPLMCVLQRARYGAALLTWVLSLAAAAAVIFLVSAAFDALRSGGRDAQRSTDWKNEVEKFTE